MHVSSVEDDSLLSRLWRRDMAMLSTGRNGEAAATRGSGSGPLAQKGSPRVDRKSAGAEKAGRLGRRRRSEESLGLGSTDAFPGLGEGMTQAQTGFLPERHGGK